ncbi:MAG: hypothetical protein DI539_20410 [Flavobacterium psychrophilum]|nr:MAG: hypothetical protein DI539_20410 [Flavobacterium psychrophilum]
MAQQVEILSINIDTQALIKNLADTKKQIDQLQASQKELVKAGQGSSEQYVQQAAQLKALQQSYNSQLKVQTQLIAADKEAANATAALNTALNKEVNSIDAATQSNKELRTIRNSLNASTESGAAAIAEINKKIDSNTQFIKENASAYEKQKMNVGNYTESIKEALANINPLNGGIAGFNDRAKEAGGAGNLLKQSFSQMATGIGQATKAGLAFIATPIGAAIAALTAAFVAGKEIFDFNKGLQEANKELKALGVNAKDLSNVRSEITATAETFDKDFQDIASKANSLAKAYGISMSEANRIIAEGLASGGAQSDEFLESLGEYSVQFKNVGYSAQEFVNILNTGAELGIYSDKLPDAIKESSLALTEQSKATRDALVNAFGASFSDDILKQVRTGEKTTAEALDALAKKSSETALTQQQQAQLTADVFKGAGEDAGGAAKIFEAISQASNKEMDATAKKQLELVESTEALNKAQAELFEVKNFGDIWTSVKVMATDALTAMLTYIADVKKDLQPLIDFIGIVLANAFTSLKTTVSVAFNLIKANVQIITNALSTFFNFFKALVTGDFKGAIDALKNGFNNLLNIVNNTFAGIKNTIINGLQSIVKNVAPVLKALGVDIDALNKKLDSMKSKTVNVKANTSTTDTKTTKNVVADVDPNSAANAKAAADAAKKATDEQVKATDRLIKKYQEELNLFIASQDFKKKSIQEELALQKQITDKKLALNELEYSKGKKSKEAYETEKLNLTNTYLKAQADATVKVAQDELNEYKKNIQKKKEDDTFYTEEKLQAQIAENNSLMQKEIDFQATRKEQGQINEKEYLDAVDAIKEENRIKNEEAEALRKEAKKEQEAIDLENQQILDEEKFTNEFDKQLAREEARYQAELKAAEKTGAATDKIEAKHAENKKNINKAKEMANLQFTSDALGQAAGLFKENTLAYKALAIAQATMNTYMGATKALADYSYPLGPIFAGLTIAQGLMSVAKISGVKLAEGGIVPTLSSGVINNGSNIMPLSNGDDTLAYVTQGEVILNKEQQARAGGANFFRSIGVPGYASGGVVGGYSSIPSMQNMAAYKIDYDQLASKIGQEVGIAYAQAPAPRVIVEDINSGQANLVRVESGAEL